jgi:hypothetical protein
VGPIDRTTRLEETPHPAATRNRCADPSLAAPPLKGRGLWVLGQARPTRYFTGTGSPATISITSLAAEATRWLMIPASSRNFRARALSGTMP